MRPWTDSSQAWPAEPYPGLRPFLEREAALLFGRTRQIAEVIARLRQTQFVAVLGGSGSGKSSLIHAGVTPELRSYGIHAAGDLWLPTVCTPGTNVGAEDRAAQRHTPVVRLARRFAELLTSRGSAQADAERVQAIAAVFRQEGGFARLLDVFGHELALEPGLKPEEARVLFVLDQFEEVFHPTNADVEDARILVERTLDHFFAPHPRCYVVLTMRSEHLNDCAGFLELPDAINKSSYLVRRLDPDELREAIVGPTEHFLRLMQLKRQRDEDSGVDVDALPPLPAQVEFEPRVIARLRKDVGDITDDPDHLPLLQHLLARLWQVAQARELAPLLAASPQLAAADVVPGHITWADLHGAVTAQRTPTGALGDGNALRASVDAWPTAAMRKFSAAEREAVDEVLRRLAFKDPKTGMYSQQRLRVVQEAPRILGLGKTADDLYTLLHQRFLSSVNYLYWDRRDPDNVTLKVSHEALIRGWAHFQQLVDTEFQHYEGFVAMLRRCADWLDNGQHGETLLRTLELARWRDSPLPDRLGRPELRTMWLRQLKRERDADRLISVEPALDDFLQRSLEQEQWQQQRAIEAQQQAQARRRTASRRRWALGIVMAAVPWTTILLFYYGVQQPITVRVVDTLNAGSQANSAPLSQVQPVLHGDAATLLSLLQAAQAVERARVNVSPADSLLPGVADQEAFVRSVAQQVESAVNGQLRRLLGSAVWASHPPPAHQRLPRPKVFGNATCRQQTGARDEARGDLIVQQFEVDAASARTGDSSAWARRPRRAVFNLKNAAGTDTMEVFAATADANGQNCSFGPALARIPMKLSPSAVVDSELRLLAYGVAGAEDMDASRAVTVLGIEWERDAAGRNRLRRGATRSIILDEQSAAPEAASAAQGSAAGGASTTAAGGARTPTTDWSPDESAQAALALAQQSGMVSRVAIAAGGVGELNAVDSWRVAGGRVLKFNDQLFWRLSLPTADRLQLPADDGRVAAELAGHQRALRAGLQLLLPPDKTGSACDPLKEQVSWLVEARQQPGVELVIHAHEGHCFVLIRRDDEPRRESMPLQGNAAPEPSLQTVSLSVFPEPNTDGAEGLGLGSPAPVASLTEFGRVQGSWLDVYVGVSGPCQGWLLLKTRESTEAGSSYLAAPWSTAALQRLGEEILQAQPQPPAEGGNCVLPQSRD